MGTRAARILIVEDEFLIAMECEWILRNAGHEVVGTAADEQQALSLAESARPDLVLMDIRLARSGDGIEVAKSILSRWGIRSLFVSAHGDRNTQSRARTIEPVGWLTKPYTAGMLIDAVEEALVRLD
jgi:two-component system, response regulator PdtaR